MSFFRKQNQVKESLVFVKSPRSLQHTLANLDQLLQRAPDSLDELAEVKSQLENMLTEIESIKGNLSRDSER